ncbi:hypothetical protein OSB04_024035 [Centaurea solstitialis]|uniref:Uncharacterized protein n=1 Tax=Centaurea solstitialis TaxID=347529 RepID=A0AA38T4V8_9ASTR|nr:hypothetical protein OSB04_024035 [Centaurea solstitialis]
METALNARNLEAKVCSIGGIEDAAMLTSKRFQMPYLRERRTDDCLRGGYQERKTVPAPVLDLNRAVLVVTEFIAEKIKEVENVYKEYTVEIFEVDFRINLISGCMKKINVMIDMDWLTIVDCACQLVRIPGPKWGIIGRVRRKRAHHDGILFGCDDETVPVAWVHELFSLRLRRSVERKRSIGIPADRHVKIRFDLMLGSAPVARTPVV